MHPVEQFLKIHGTDGIEMLKQEPYMLSVKEEFNENGKGVWVIDYDQIKSPRNHPLVDECRGIVVEQETLRVICWPFRRFYNLGEFPEMEKKFDWTTALCQGKEDGSLIKVYYFDGKWRIGTRGTAFGQNTIVNLVGEESNITFEKLFLRAAGISEREFNQSMNAYFDKTTNVFFELCTPENKVVTRYENDIVFIHGFRSQHHPDFVHPVDDFIGEYFIPAWCRGPVHYDVGSFEDALKTANELPDLKEGYVLIDANGFRIKVKSPLYVVAHHTRGNGMTPKRAVDLVLMNEYHEFVSYFPETEEYIMKYVNSYNDILSGANRAFEEFGHLESQKDFALAIKHLPYAGILFSMRKGLTNLEAFNNMTLNSKYKLLGAE